MSKIDFEIPEKIKVGKIGFHLDMFEVTAQDYETNFTLERPVGYKAIAQYSSDIINPKSELTITENGNTPFEAATNLVDKIGQTAKG